MQMKKPTKRTTTRSRKGGASSSLRYRSTSRPLRVAESTPATKPRTGESTPWVDPLPPAERMERNRRAAALLREWMEEDSDYDEQVGAALEAMGDFPVRFREDFE